MSGYPAEDKKELKHVDPHNPGRLYRPLLNQPPWADDQEPPDLPETDLRKTGEVIPTITMPSNEERGLPPEE